MNADMVLVRKEIGEYWRTWRLRLLLIPIIFLALSGPLFAYFAPEILKAALGSQSEAFGTIPDPVWQDVYQQWAKNLQQIVPFLIIVISSGAIAGECASGTIVPVVSGGYSRANIVIVKAIVHTVMGIGAVAAGTLATWSFGYLLFPDISFLAGLRVVGIASLLVMLIVTAAILASSWMKETLGAVGVSVAVFFGMAGLTFWAPARHWSPVGLLPLLGDAIAGDASVVGPAIATIVISLVCVAGAVWVFRRRELPGA